MGPQPGTYQPVTQQPGYAPTPAETVVSQPRVVVVMLNVGEHPQNMVCPFCHNNIVTQTTYKMGIFAWFSAAGMCLLCCCWAGLIPCFVNWFKDVSHQCPSCKTVVGTNKTWRMGARRRRGYEGVSS